MADEFASVKLEGWEDVQKALRELEAGVDKKVLRQTVRASARPMIKRARQIVNSPVIAKGIKTVSVKSDPDGTVTGKVGLPGGSHPWYHGLFLERGTGPRVQKTTGRRTGSMPAQPFLRPALDQTRDEMVEVFGVEIRKRIEKYGRS